MFINKFGTQPHNPHTTTNTSTNTNTIILNINSIYYIY